MGKIKKAHLDEINPSLLYDGGGICLEKRMKYVFLTTQFYSDYINCPEIEQKQLRPYVMLIVKIDDLTFALPLRSHIKHKYAYFTDKEKGCGIDYSKAVVITNSDLYVEKEKVPYIRPNEYKNLLGKNIIIEKAFRKYLKDYKKAMTLKTDRKNYTYKFSTLQYFHKELGLA